MVTHLLHVRREHYSFPDAVYFVTILLSNCVNYGWICKLFLVLVIRAVHVPYKSLEQTIRFDVQHRFAMLAKVARVVGSVILRFRPRQVQVDECNLQIWTLITPAWSKFVEIGPYQVLLLKEHENVLPLLTWVEDLLKLSALAALDRALHWVWHDEKPAAFEPVVPVIQVPKTDHSELPRAGKGAIGQMLALVFRDIRVVCRSHACYFIRHFDQVRVLVELSLVAHSPIDRSAPSLRSIRPRSATLDTFIATVGRGGPEGPCLRS